MLLALPRAHASLKDLLEVSHGLLKRFGLLPPEPPEGILGEVSESEGEFSIEVWLCLGPWRSLSLVEDREASLETSIVECITLLKGLYDSGSMIQVPW